MADAVGWPLAAVAVGGLLLGLMPLLWIFRRLGRAIAGSPQSSAGLFRYLAALAASAILVGAAIAAFGLAFALQTFHAFAKKTHVAELQAIELGPQKLRVYFVPIEPDGVRGATEIYDLAGDQWTVGGDILRFRPLLTVMGLETVYKVTRVEGRWLKAKDANGHTGTAFDRSGGSRVAWLRLYQNGARGPLRWLVAGVHGQAVSQLPDRRAVYDLYVTPNGFVLDKRTL